MMRHCLVVAASLQGLLGVRLDETAMNSIMDKIEPTVDTLVVPKVNPLIWGNIPSKLKSRDLRLQQLQHPVIKALIALANMLPEKTSPEQQEVLALLAYANFEVHMFHKESVKPDLNPKYHPLCKADVKVTDNLFGGDLGKVVRVMNEQQKAASVTKIGAHKTTKEGVRLSHISGVSGDQVLQSSGMGSTAPVVLS